jgi:SAM-dependent methyltransferase
MMTAKSHLQILYRLLEVPGVYAVNQFLARPTTDRFRQLIRKNIGDTSNRRVLDIGCGIGNYRSSFGGNYVGIDINPDYIASARKALPDRFEVMDASKLSLQGERFDDAVTIATTHHLTDDEFLGMTAGALSILYPQGAFHVIDAIMPISSSFAFKKFWFGLDRGQHPRRLEDLLGLARRGGKVVRYATLTGPLHDTVYIRITH